VIQSLRRQNEQELNELNERLENEKAQNRQLLNRNFELSKDKDDLEYRIQYLERRALNENQEEEQRRILQ
jgi:hypothetical protein